MAEIKKLCKQSRFYWICVMITSVLSYGFTLTNFAITADDEFFERFIHDGVLLAEGRWGYVPIQRIFNSYIFLPFWRNFIALILIVVGITFICGLFRKYSKGRFDEKAATIFACVAISFPITAHIFSFMLATIELGLNLVFVALALLWFVRWALEKKQHWYGVLSALSLGYGIAFRETAVVFFMISGFALLLLVFLYGEDEEVSKFKSSMLIFVKMAGVLIVAVAVWFFGAMLFQRLLSVEALVYTAGMVRYDTTNSYLFFRSIVDFVVTFPIMVLRTTSGVASWLVIGFSLILMGVGAVYAVKKKRVSILLTAVFLVISSYAMFLVLGWIDPYYRMRTPFMILVGFTVALGYIISAEIEWKKVKFKYFVVFVSIWLVFYGSRMTNQIFYLDYMTYKKDVFVMETIIHDLEGLHIEYPIIFVGVLPQQLPLIEKSGYSIFNSGRRGTWHSEIEVMRAHRFFEMHGFPIEHPGVVPKEQILEHLPDMENWPTQGYIRRAENFVIVKLGISSLEHFLENDD